MSNESEPAKNSKQTSGDENDPLGKVYFAGITPRKDDGNLLLEVAKASYLAALAAQRKLKKR